MKLFLKILLFVLAAIVASVNVTNVAVIFPNIQQTTASLSVHKEMPKTVFKVFENDLVNDCQNEQDLVAYRERGKVIEAIATR